MSSTHGKVYVQCFPILNLKDVTSSQVKVKAMLRQTASRRVRFGVRHRPGIHDHFFLLDIFFRQFRFYYFVVPSLTRGQVCNLLLLLGLASAVPLWPESRGTQDHILFSQFLRPLQEGQILVFISPRNRVAQIYPWALGSLSIASYDLQGYGVGILS
jgi:hypothetical protein